MRRWALVALLVLTGCVFSAHAKPHHSHSPSPTSSPSPSPSVKHVAVLLVNFADDQRQPWTTDFISQLYNGAGPSVTDFFTQSSWGQFHVSGDVFGWFGTSATSCDLGTMQADADAAATAAGVNLAAYTNTQYIFPDRGTCNFGGSANFPGQGSRSYINMPSACDGLATCQTWGLKLIIHELGHNYGLDHAQSYICTDGAVHVVLSSTCTANEYGDPFSEMAYARALFSNVERLQLGWIPPSQVVTVTQTQTLTITPATSQASLVYRIPDGTGQFLYLENRPGVDIYMNAPTPNLLIRRAPDYTVAGQLGAAPKTQILDGSPADNDQSLNDKNLHVGDSFTVPGGPTITHVAWDGTDDVVQVTYP